MCRLGKLEVGWGFLVLAVMALIVGIIIALIARGLFILAGSVIIEHFVGVFYIFGLFLLWSGGTMLLGAFRRPDSGQTEE